MYTCKYLRDTKFSYEQTKTKKKLLIFFLFNGKIFKCGLDIGYIIVIENKLFIYIKLLGTQQII